MVSGTCRSYPGKRWKCAENGCEQVKISINSWYIVGGSILIQTCKNGYGAVVGLILVKGISVEKYARTIDAKQIFIFGRLPGSCPGGPCPQ